MDIEVGAAMAQLTGVLVKHLTSEERAAAESELRDLAQRSEGPRATFFENAAEAVATYERDVSTG